MIEENEPIRITITRYFCDDCGDPIPVGKECFINSLTTRIVSANEGESATLCKVCHDEQIKHGA